MRHLLPSRGDFASRSPRHDLIAGLTVAVVALPLALGFGLASGLGAAAGLTTAIVAGVLAAAFGGSNLQVSGPTGAMTVVLVPIVHRYGSTGVLTVGLLAGVALLGLAAVGAGRYVRHVPAPVVEGFTAGIAAVIFLQQVPAVLGVPTPHGEKVALVAARAIAAFARTPHWPAVCVAMSVATAMLLGAKWRPAVPFSLLAIAVATVVTETMHVSVVRIGRLPTSFASPAVDFLDASIVATLIPSALAVAALAALESLLSATAADGMTVNEHHDPDRELFGQGLANIVVPFFGGMPATAAIARTAVNVRAGATSRFAALIHAIALAGIVLVAAPVVGRIPVAALAGVLLATAIRMVEVSSLLALARSTRSDGVILALTAVATLALDLVTAVIVGLVVAGGLALAKVSRAAFLEEVPLEPGDHHAEESDLLSEHIVAYRIDGPLFFVAAHRFLLELSEVAAVSVVILRLSRITVLDGTGAQVLGDAVRRLEHRGITVLVSGLKSEHAKTFATLGVLDDLRAAGRIFDNTPAAISWAREHLHRTGVLSSAH